MGIHLSGLEPLTSGFVERYPFVKTTKRKPETERSFQNCVIHLAQLHGWHVMHQRPARVERKGKTSWRTAIEGNAGFPDLVLARHGVVICAELKSNKGKLSESQQHWLVHLGALARVWRPEDWDDIHDELTARVRSSV